MGDFQVAPSRRLCAARLWHWRIQRGPESSNHCILTEAAKSRATRQLVSPGEFFVASLLHCSGIDGLIKGHVPCDILYPSNPQVHLP